MMIETWVVDPPSCIEFKAATTKQIRSKTPNTLCFRVPVQNTLEIISASILGSERPKMAKMNPKNPSEASTIQKPTLAKTLKNKCFFKVFDNKGFSREPQKAQEGSQKATKKSNTPKNKNPNLYPKKYKMLKNIVFGKTL